MERHSNEKLIRNAAATMMHRRARWRKSQSRITISRFDRDFAQRSIHISSESRSSSVLSYLLSVKTLRKTILPLARRQSRAMEVSRKYKVRVSILFDIYSRNRKTCKNDYAKKT